MSEPAVWILVGYKGIHHGVDRSFVKGMMEDGKFEWASLRLDEVARGGEGVTG
jgi:hypothetical protein